MAYYRSCPYCGCHLDPGERCDCQDEKPSEAVQITAIAIPAKGGEVRGGLLMGTGRGLSRSGYHAAGAT